MTTPTTATDDLDMRALLNDTMTKLGVKTAPLTGIAPPAAPDTGGTPKPPLTRQEQLLGAGIGLVLLIIATVLWNQFQPRAGVPVQSLPTTVSVPTAAPVPTAPPVAMLPAFAAPGGTQLGQIEATRAITPVAHFGADWIQAQVAGSGLIWLRAADFPALAIVGPDLAPQRPAAIVAPDAVAPPAAEPPCFMAGMGNQTVTVCDWLNPAELEAAAAAKWAATYGGHVGRGDVTPTPDFMTTPPNSSIEVRQAMIGDDPNALACQNDKGVASALCGGITNAQAQAALDAERAAR